MDLELIETRLAELRQRREFIPELRDYKPQARKAKTTKEPATPVGTRDTEDVFGALFATDDKEDSNVIDGKDAGTTEPGSNGNQGEDPKHASTLLGSLVDGTPDADAKSV